MRKIGQHVELLKHTFLYPNLFSEYKHGAKQLFALSQMLLQQCPIKNLHVGYFVELKDTE